MCRQTDGAFFKSYCYKLTPLMLRSTQIRDNILLPDQKKKCVRGVGWPGCWALKFGLFTSVWQKNNLLISWLICFQCSLEFIRSNVSIFSFLAMMAVCFRFYFNCKVQGSFPPFSPGSRSFLKLRLKIPLRKKAAFHTDEMTFVIMWKIFDHMKFTCEKMQKSDMWDEHVTACFLHFHGNKL